MPRASTNLGPFCSISMVLHTPASTQTNFYTQPTFTQTCFYTKHFVQKTHFYSNQFLHKPALFDTNLPLHRPPFTPTSSYTNEFLHTSFYTHQLFDQPAFTQTTSCTNQLLQTSFCTNQLLHTPDHTSFYTNQLLGKSPFLRKPPFTPTSFTQPLLWACRPKARGLAKCRRLLICPFVLQIYSISSWLHQYCPCGKIEGPVQ